MGGGVMFWVSIEAARLWVILNFSVNAGNELE